MKFARDRNDYRERLRQILPRFEISLLDYCQTSNHVHLLSRAEKPDQISRFMQTLEGEFAQAYHRRHNRSGADWSDRFHATMIEPDGHLLRCMVYIALNMRRCGVVSHPREWPWCGYDELTGRRRRYRVLDMEWVLRLLGGVSASEFRDHYEAAITETIAKDLHSREPEWTESIAVGSESFVREVAERIERRQQLEIRPAGEQWVLREAVGPYGSALDLPSTAGVGPPLCSGGLEAEKTREKRG
jgi:putative transposase